jgi:hypothetical protein
MQGIRGYAAKERRTDVSSPVTRCSGGWTSNRHSKQEELLGLPADKRKGGAWIAKARRSGDSRAVTMRLGWPTPAWRQPCTMRAWTWVHAFGLTGVRKGGRARASAVLSDGKDRDADGATVAVVAGENPGGRARERENGLNSDLAHALPGVKSFPGEGTLRRGSGTTSR